MNKIMSPAELDKQSPVRISRWLDIDSSELKEIDDDRKFTKKIILMGFEEQPGSPAWMYTDAQGRIFGWNPKNPDAPHYPLHFTAPSGELIGYKISKKAAN